MSRSRCLWHDSFLPLHLSSFIRESSSTFYLIAILTLTVTLSGPSSARLAQTSPAIPTLSETDAWSNRRYFKLARPSLPRARSHSGSARSLPIFLLTFSTTIQTSLLSNWLELNLGISNGCSLSFLHSWTFVDTRTLSLSSRSCNTPNYVRMTIDSKARMSITRSEDERKEKG